MKEKREKGYDDRNEPYLTNFYFQDDNLSLSLLNELSVKYGIQTHLSHAPLPQKLEELREYLRREIKKELKVSIKFFGYCMFSLFIHSKFNI